MDRLGRLNEVMSKLVLAGHRISPQRLSILNTLMCGPSHPSAEEVHAIVLQEHPHTSLATVYKTIDALRDIGEIRLVAIAGGRGHFDALDPSNHPHVICTSCGRTEDVAIDGGSSQLQTAAQRSGFEIHEERLQFFGLCPACCELRCAEAV